MPLLNDKEKNELKELARSLQLKGDTERLAAGRYNPFVINGEIDIDKFLSFLTQYNQFINHRPKLFQKIIDKDMRL
jgi:hypothetical protein